MKRGKGRQERLKRQTNNVKKQCGTMIEMVVLLTLSTNKGRYLLYFVVNLFCILKLYEQIFFFF